MENALSKYLSSSTFVLQLFPVAVGKTAKEVNIHR